MDSTRCAAPNSLQYDVLPAWSPQAQCYRQCYRLVPSLGLPASACLAACPSWGSSLLTTVPTNIHKPHSSCYTAVLSCPAAPGPIGGIMPFPMQGMPPFTLPAFCPPPLHILRALIKYVYAMHICVYVYVCIVYLYIYIYISYTYLIIFT